MSCLQRHPIKGAGRPDNRKPYPAYRSKPQWAYRSAFWRPSCHTESRASKNKMPTAVRCCDCHRLNTDCDQLSIGRLLKIADPPVYFQSFKPNSRPILSVIVAINSVKSSVDDVVLNKWRHIAKNIADAIARS